MKTIKIYDEILVYNEEVLNISNLNEITHNDAKEVLFITKQILDKANIHFYLGFGTLLGAVRDKDFIKGDLDVDIIVKDEKKLVKTIKHFHDRGLNLVRAVPHKLYSFRLNNNCYIDMYIQSVLPKHNLWSLWCDRICKYYVPRKLLKGESTIAFLGENFKTVQDPVALLRFWYGDTWNIPIGKFDKKYYYEVKSHHYYKQYGKKCKDYIKQIIGENNYEKLKSIIK